MANLYVIGNGFDLHHGLNTNYIDYRNYLEQNGECCWLLKTYPKNNRFWADIERGLRIDYEQYIKDYINAFNYKEHIPGEMAEQDFELAKKKLIMYIKSINHLLVLIFISG